MRHPIWRSSDVEHGRLRGLEVHLRSGLQVFESILDHVLSSEDVSLPATQDCVTCGAPTQQLAAGFAALPSSFQLLSGLLELR